MIAAWMRIRYPHIIFGAHASSAPILFFPGSVSPYAFNEYATRSYKNALENCDTSIRRGFQILNDWSKDKNQYDKIKQYLNTCDTPTTPEQIQFAISEISDGLGSMA